MANAHLRLSTRTSSGWGRRVLAQSHAAMVEARCGNFDSVLGDHEISRPHFCAAPHAPRDILYLASHAYWMLLSCLCDQFSFFIHVFRPTREDTGTSSCTMTSTSFCCISPLPLPPNTSTPVPRAPVRDLHDSRAVYML